MFIQAFSNFEKKSEHQIFYFKYVNDVNIVYFNLLENLVRNPKENVVNKSFAAIWNGVDRSLANVTPADDIINCAWNLTPVAQSHANQVIIFISSDCSTGSRSLFEDVRKY